ncbi:putative Protein SDA1 like protein [Blattamonas nauphoetae]|uniref:Protein SDA1 n=1 Tax=Blattamonas nauphoetae TaxID=2049346 RepID=A0ABQ9Y4L2_9EUKA|nr:putative Protein SDA1 like protein [Blattamonas nauphoetae]
MAEDLFLLQERVKSNPSLYPEEITQIYSHFKELTKLYEVNPTKLQDDFAPSVAFLAQVAPHIQTILSTFPTELVEFLDKYAAQIPQDARVSLTKSVLQMNNRDLLDPVVLIPIMFKLFLIPDRECRDTIYFSLISFLKKYSTKTQYSNKMKAIQQFLYASMRDETPIIAKKAMDIVIALFQRCIWQNTATISILTQMCFHKDNKLKRLAVLFFLGCHSQQLGAEASNSKPGDNDDDYLNISSGPSIERKVEGITAPQHVTRQDIYNLSKKSTKNSAKRKRRLEAAQKLAKKQQKADDGTLSYAGPPPSHIMQMIPDPHDFAQALLTQLTKSHFPFEFRLISLDLISRLIGTNQLMLLQFYPFISRFLRPTQREISKLLAITAQSFHNLVPPDEGEQVIRTIAERFIQPVEMFTSSTNKRVSSSTASMASASTSQGINTIREICARTPLSMSREMLAELTEYRHAREKNIQMAAKGLIGLFRVVNPLLLEKKERGREIIQSEILQRRAREKLEKDDSESQDNSDDASEKEDKPERQYVTVPVRVPVYGQVNIQRGIAGAELLPVDKPAEKEEPIKKTKRQSTKSKPVEDPFSDFDSDDVELEYVEDLSEVAAELDEKKRIRKEMRRIRNEKPPQPTRVDEDLSEKEDSAEDSSEEGSDEVSHSESEPEQKPEQPMVRADEVRILTEDDFNRLKQLRSENKIGPRPFEIDPAQFVDEDDILGDAGVKRDKAAKLRAAKEGRAGMQHKRIDKKKEKKLEMRLSTNAEKQKKKKDIGGVQAKIRRNKREKGRLSKLRGKSRQFRGKIKK